MTGLAQDIAALFEQGAAAPREAAREAFLRLRDELAAGRVRAAEPDAASPTGWRVNVWVKQGILLGFRFGDMADMSIGGQWPFFDKDTMPLKRLNASIIVKYRDERTDVRTELERWIR